MTKFVFDTKTAKSFFPILKDGTIVFGGAIRSLIRNSYEDKINDIDVLVKSKEELEELCAFVEKKNSYSYFNVEKCSGKYNDDNFDHYSAHFYSNDGSTPYVVLDIIIPKNPNKEFISDFDVNSLYGVYKNRKINVIGSIHNESDVGEISNNIAARKANAIFKPGVSQNQIIWREGKLASKNYIINSTLENNSFMTSNSIFLDVEYFLKNENSYFNNDSKTTETNNSQDKESKKVMSKSNVSFGDRLKQNVTEGLYQAGARVAVDTFIQTALLGMEKAGVDPITVAFIKHYANTDVGFAIVSGIIGAGTPMIPLDSIQQNELAMKIADKCVENAAADSAQVMTNIAANFIKPALEAAVSSLTQTANLSKQIKPEQTVTLPQQKVRVADQKDIDDLSPEEIESTIQALKAKQKSLSKLE